MTANITIYTQVLENVMKIPASATSFRPDSLIIKNISSMLLLQKVKMGKRKNTGKRSTQAGTGSNNEAGVWVIGKDSITRKRIKTGMDNDTEIQVISGLNKNDNIITGYKNLSKKSSGGSAKSPFMPQRRAVEIAEGTKAELEAVVPDKKSNDLTHKKHFQILTRNHG
jgi:HlyD family secretion protein